MIDKIFDEVQEAVNDYLQSFFETGETQRAIITPTKFNIPNVNYLQYIEFIGTTHFSKRSFHDVIEAARKIKPIGISLELCPFRYEYFRSVCINCSNKSNCNKKCEFIVAIDTFGKLNVDLWLIDMTQEEITARVVAKASPEEARAWSSLQSHIAYTQTEGLRLWEEGLKSEAINLFNGNLELMKKTFPTLWNVLILERNVLMTCRLIYITSKYLEKNMIDFKIIFFAGATHVESIKKLLKIPERTFQQLNQLGISFSAPYLVIKKQS